MRLPLPKYTAVAACIGLVAGVALVASPLPSVRATETVAATVGNCFNYKSSGTKDQAASAPAVDCTTPHTAQTYWTGTLPESFGVPEKAKAASRLKQIQPCTVKNLNAFVNLGDRKLPTRLQSVSIFPSKAQWGAGQRWVRCDVVFRAGKSYKPLSTPMAEFVATTPISQLNFCTPRVPGNRTTSAYPCTNVKKKWIMILERNLGTTPTKKFPGSRAVEFQTKRICENAAKPYVTLKKYYPWWAIWPASAGWSRGDRTAQCFVPYSEFVKNTVSQ
jgi:hypothetical protein